LCGTDAPNPGTTFGASMHEELALLVGAGLTPSAALTAATAAPAERFGLTDRGRIIVGARADLVLVDGDPTRDIQATRRIEGIWRGGHRFDRDAYRRQIAETTRAADAKAAAARAAQGALGLVSDFEHGTAARPGEDWKAMPDALSSAKIRIVAGAHGSAGALEITGELVLGTKAFGWSGAVWSPGPEPFATADLSAKRGFSFLARGDGKPYTVSVFAERRGMFPSSQTFQAGATFGKVSFTWSQFDGLDSRDVTGVFIGQTSKPGKLELVIDDVTLE